jgi:hypothetical protein
VDVSPSTRRNTKLQCVGARICERRVLWEPSQSPTNPETMSVYWKDLSVEGIHEYTSCRLFSNARQALKKHFGVQVAHFLQGLKRYFAVVFH